jgi:hypothetical protein
MNYDERHRARALKIVGAANLIRRRVGNSTPEELQIAQLATISEMKGLWQALLDKALITEEQRQGYLDRGAQELLNQIESHASQIYIQDGGHG